MELEADSDVWAQIRYAYEHTDRPVDDICAEHGISSGTLRDRVRRWHWKPRRVPIPRVGPPAVIPPYREIGPSAPLPAGGERTAAGAERGWPGEGAFPHTEPGENAPHPMSSLCSDIDLSPHSPSQSRSGFASAEPGAGRGDQAPDLAAAPSVDPLPPKERHAPEADAAAIVPRLQSAVARVLPAIEATIARLAEGPQRPREMEQAGRALGALTRTLRELNALLSEHNARAPCCNCHDDMPEDLDAFREELARRIDAFVASRPEEAEEAMREKT
jgi:hypothetical protein